MVRASRLLNFGYGDSVAQSTARGQVMSLQQSTVSCKLLPSGFRHGKGTRMGRPGKQAQQRSSRVICYVRVSTDEQRDSGLGLAAQRAKLESECAYRGWTDALFIEDAGHSAKSLDRPGIRRALELLSANDAGVLMVAKLDRLSRSVIDFANLMDLANREGWLLVVLDLGVDMTTATGRMVAGIMAQLAQ